MIIKIINIYDLNDYNNDLLIQEVFNHSQGCNDLGDGTIIQWDTMVVPDYIDIKSVEELIKDAKNVEDAKEIIKKTLL